jgi:predicted DNA-binding WGR domain protein
MSNTRRFEFVEGSSQKFWEVSLEGSSVVTRYGKIGASGQTTTKDEGSPEKARTLYEKLVREKTGKGYVEQAGGGSEPAKESAPAAAAASKGGYRARFVAMVEELQKDERFEVKKVNIGEPASPALIAQAAEAAGGTLPPGVAELYAEMNGFELVWTQIDGFHDDLQGDGEPTGYIDIPEIYAPRVAGGVFSDWRDSLYFSDDDPLRHIKPIDNSGGELGANTLAVFFPIPGKATIHYHDGDGELHPTGYSLDEYLDRVLACRGYRYWTGSLCVDLQDSSSVEDFLHDAPLLFKDWKRALFKPKTKAGQVSFE